VASEVRNLAGCSATAAKEIKELIQDSVKKVSDGSVLVTQSGQTLEQIVASVKKVSDIVAEIAAASREQSTGIGQVNRAVLLMDELTQQNAALVEQATSASQSMAEEAHGLHQMMGGYNLGDGVSAGGGEVVDTVATDAVGVNTQTGAANKSGAAARAERRKGSRPWSSGARIREPERKRAGAERAAEKVDATAAPATVGAGAAALPAATAAAENGEWQEF
jgi:uncharacterized phage infection (PIP) family protein YhgE